MLIAREVALARFGAILALVDNAGSYFAKPVELRTGSSETIRIWNTTCAEATWSQRSA